MASFSLGPETDSCELWGVEGCGEGASLFPLFIFQDEGEGNGLGWTRHSHSSTILIQTHFDSRDPEITEKYVYD